MSTSDYSSCSNVFPIVDCLVHNSDRHDEHHGNPFEEDAEHQRNPFNERDEVNEIEPEVDVTEHEHNCSVEDLPHSNYECDDDIV